jgi:hypothetical protein
MIESTYHIPGSDAVEAPSVDVYKTIIEEAHDDVDNYFSSSEYVPSLEDKVDIAAVAFFSHHLAKKRINTALPGEVKKAA